MRRVLLWAVVSLLVAASTLALLTFTYFWRSPAYYPQPPATSLAEARIIPRSQYSEEHRRPYTYRHGNVVVFGAEHKPASVDRQLRQIDEMWRELRPTVALVEGRLGFLAPGFMDPVEHYGESGHVYALAKKDDVQAYTWEQPLDEHIAYLARVHAKDRVALFMVLRPYFSKLRFGKPESPEAFVEEFLGRADHPAIRGEINSVADIDRIWQRDFAGGKDWRDVSDETVLPGYLERLTEDSNDQRNRYLVRLVSHLSAQGERVFVICGSSHAVVIEPALM